MAHIVLKSYCLPFLSCIRGMFSIRLETYRLSKTFGVSSSDYIYKLFGVVLIFHLFVHLSKKKKFDIYGCADKQQAVC